MTTAEILALEAGPELDALVSILVFGVSPDEAYYTLADGVRRVRLAHLDSYSSSIAAAWAVVEAFDTCEIQRWYDGKAFSWTASLTKHKPEMYAEPVRAETMPIAVCRAALLAVESARE